MDPQPGATLEHYRIVDKLGEGGMGVVWRAVDTTLDREVAIKVLPAESAESADRLARFEREAKLLASLNHPNIAAIHGLHKSGDTHFLAMELVAGEDLAKSIEAGPVPLDKALKIAHQLTRALGAAHSAGVVHRDLKPSNIRITPGNEVKVLDFGLAKALAPERGAGDGEDPARSPTVTSLGTVAGLILGTAAYMAPEQARGHEVDHRADIWAFGVVFYELLTGAQLFTGNTVSDTMAAVLTKEPEWEAVPWQVRRLLRACLQREPEDRLRDIGDARLLLDDAADDVETGAAAVAAASATGFRALWPVLAALAVGTALTAAAFTYFRPGMAPATVRFLEYPPPGTEFVEVPKPSPDGRHLAMLARAGDSETSLWVRSLADEAAHRIDGTENTRFIFWSRDGEELAFHVGGELRRVRRDGGGNRLISSVPLAQAGVWSPGDDLFVATQDRGIVRLSSDGGPTTPCFGGEGGTVRGVDLVPAGPHLIFYQFGEQTGIYTCGLVGDDAHSLLPGVNSNVRFVGPDHILYQENRVLVGQRIDPSSMALVGGPIAIAEDVAANDFDGSAVGVVSFIQGGTDRRRLTWFDRDGGEVTTLGPESGYSEIHLSPDGSRLLYVDADPTTGNRDLWIQDLPTGAPIRFTTSHDVDHLAVFSPDGKEIAWEAHSGSDLLMMRRPADGSADGVLLRAWNRGGGPADWSPDGEHVLYVSEDGATRRNIWAVPMRDDNEPFLLIDSDFDDRDPNISPDGRWLAYVSDASGAEEVYLQRLDGMKLIGGPQRISTQGGTRPQWRRDGGELFYVEGATLMAVEMQLDNDRPAGTSQPLFDLDARSALPDYAVAPDGQSILTIVGGDEPGSRPATVILNWKGAGRP